MSNKKILNLGNILEYLRVRLPHVVDRVLTPYEVAKTIPLKLLPVTYKNENVAIEMLKRAQGKDCVIHCDVDMDGVAAGNIFYKAFKFEKYFKSIDLCINQERIHGIELSTEENGDGELSLKGYGPIEKLRGGLFVVVDSSSDRLDEIKKLPCDVLVLDHHVVDCDHSELTGDTAEGKYVIINSMIMDELHPELDAWNDGVYQTSGAQVVFEIINKSGLLPNLIKDTVRHWVTVSLFSDVVNTSGPQAQRYIADWYSNGMTELKGIISQFKYAGLNKSFVNFKLAPIINGAIRAGLNNKAIEMGIKFPNKLSKLADEIDPIKRKMRELPLPLKEFPGIVISKICDTELKHEYKGMRAGGIADMHNKPAFVYHRYSYAEPGQELQEYLTGSFRGVGERNYLEYFKALGVFAKGHGNAFGLTIPVKGATDIFKNMPEVINEDTISIEERLASPETMQGYYVLCGDLGDSYKHLEGVYENCIIIHESSFNIDILEIIGKLNNRLTADEISFKILGTPRRKSVHERYAKWLIGSFEMRTFGESCGIIVASQSLLITYENGFPKLTA